jgi:hypothetical protein
MPSEIKRLRLTTPHTTQNGKLKKIVADLSFDKAMLQDVIRRKFSREGSRVNAKRAYRLYRDMGLHKPPKRKRCSVRIVQRSI